MEELEDSRHTDPARAAGGPPPAHTGLPAAAAPRTAGQSGFAALLAWLRSAFVAAPPPAGGPGGGPGGGGPFGFFRTHLRGDYPLVRAYWLHFQLGMYLTRQAQVAAQARLAYRFPPRYESLLFIGMHLLVYVVWIFLLVGAWRSAAKHAARGGVREWAVAAWLAILVNLAVQVSLAPKLAPVLRYHWGVASGWQPGPAPTLFLTRDGRSLMVYGALPDGTAEAIEGALARAPKVETVVLTLEGDWTREGRLVGDVIAAHGLDTHVHQRCTAACTLAFLAGRTRSVAPGAVLGFQPFGQWQPELSRMLLARTYAPLGLADGVIDLIAAVPRPGIWIPDSEELVRYGLVTPPGGKAPPVLEGPFTMLPFPAATDTPN